MSNSLAGKCALFLRAQPVCTPIMQPRTISLPSQASFANQKPFLESIAVCQKNLKVLRNEVRRACRRSRANHTTSTRPSWRYHSLFLAQSTLRVNGAEELGHWGGVTVYHLPDDTACLRRYIPSQNQTHPQQASRPLAEPVRQSGNQRIASYAPVKGRASVSSVLNQSQGRMCIRYKQTKPLLRQDYDQAVADYLGPMGQ